MPKLFVHAREGTFTAEGRASVAAALTDLGVRCERLADTPKVRAGVWVFFVEHGPDAAFSGGQVATKPIIGLIVYALQGGLDEASRRELIAGATAILGANAAPVDGPVPAYVVIREVPEADWGMYGEQVSLAALRAPATE